MMVNTPAIIPEHPKPHTARPAINATLVGAAADIMLPTSEITVLKRKTLLTLNNLYSLPKENWKLQ
jgi:hypothetical protein